MFMGKGIITSFFRFWTVHEMRIYCAILLLFLAMPAFGAGFVGPGSVAPVSRAADVLAASDDSPCVLEGHIIAKVTGRKNRYVFEDASGKIIVEIKKKIFGNQTVTPHNLVRLEGEVDVDEKYPNEMEADSLIILR